MREKIWREREIVRERDSERDMVRERCRRRQIEREKVREKCCGRLGEGVVVGEDIVL